MNSSPPSLHTDAIGEQCVRDGGLDGTWDGSEVACEPATFDSTSAVGDGNPRRSHFRFGN